MKTDDLKAASKVLIEQMKKESTQYCHDIVNPQILALACHPLSATLGLEILDELQVYLQEEGTPGIPIENWERKAKASLTAEIELKMSAKIDDPESSSGDNGDKKRPAVDDKWVAAEKRAAEKRGAKSQSTKPAKTGSVKEEVDDFFALRLNWPDQLRIQRVDEAIIKFIRKYEDDWRNNYYIIANNFNVFEWWHCKGKHTFKYTFVIACTILTLPKSNRRQKRIFSDATWMDTKLATKQDGVTLEMKSLLYANRKFIADVQPFLYEEHKKMAAKATRNMLDMSAKWRAEDDDDDDDDCKDTDGDDYMMATLLPPDTDDASQLTEENN